MASRELTLATEESWLRRSGAGARGALRDFLVVEVHGEEYGVEILAIREIIKVRAATEVPRAPTFVLGVIGVRGVVVPVIDLGQRLRHPRAASGPGARILIVARDEEPFGLLVDRVREVVRLGESQIEGAPPTLGDRADWIRAIGRPSAGRLVVLLDLEPLLRFEVQRRGERAPAVRR